MKMHTFVNPQRSKFWTIRISHRVPVVTTRWGTLGKKGWSKTVQRDSREDASDYAEPKIDVKVRHGFIQVA
jgi:predicted DNA-binding WGR domain protein